MADGGIGGGTAGSIYIVDGTETLTGNNTFTGEVYVEPLATLALSGKGSVATANTVVFDGVVDISSTTSGTSITGMSGSGTVYLGSKILNITGPSNPLFDTFSGDIQGSGQFNILDGTQTLSGTNHLTGDMTVAAGKTLTITSAAALGSGTLNLVGNATAPAVLSIKNSTTINNPITISGDPTFYVAPGAVYTQAGVISNGATPGDIVITGGGTVVLSAINTYTGPTVINASTVLQLLGSGSIQTSQKLTNNGIFDISGASGAVFLQSLAGAGQFIQGAYGLTILDAPTITTASNPSLNLGVIKTPIAPPAVGSGLGQETVTNTLTTAPSSTTSSAVASNTVISPPTPLPDISQQVVSNSPPLIITSPSNINVDTFQTSTQIAAISFVEPPSTSNAAISNNPGVTNGPSSIVNTTVEPSTQMVAPSTVVADTLPSPKLNSKPVPSDSLDQGDTSLAQITPPVSDIPAPKAESRREIRVTTTPVATGVSIQKVIPIKQPVTRVFQHPISGYWSTKE